MVLASLGKGDRTEGDVAGSIVGNGLLVRKRAVGGADGEAEVAALKRGRRDAVLGRLDHLGGGQGLDGGGISLVGVRESLVLGRGDGGHKLALVVIGHGNGDLLGALSLGGNAARQAVGLLRDLVGVNAGLGVGDVAKGDGTVSRVGDGGLLGQRGVVVARRNDLEAELAGLEVAALEHLLEGEVRSTVDGDGLGLVAVLEDAGSAVVIARGCDQLAVLLDDLDGHHGGVRVVGVARGSGAGLGHVELVGAGLVEGNRTEREALGLAGLSARDRRGVGALGDDDLVAIVLSGGKLEVERRGHVVTSQGLRALDGGLALEGDRPGLVGVGHGEGTGAGDRRAVGGVVVGNSGLLDGPGELAHAGGDGDGLGPVVGRGELEGVAVVLAVLLQLDGDGGGKRGVAGVLPCLGHGDGINAHRDGRLLVAVRLLVGNLVVLAGLLDDGLVVDLRAISVVGEKINRLAGGRGSIVGVLVGLDSEDDLVGRALLKLADRLEVPRQGIAIDSCLRGVCPRGGTLVGALLVADVDHIVEVDVLGELVDDLHVLVERGLLDGLGNLLEGGLHLLLRRAIEEG